MPRKFTSKPGTRAYGHKTRYTEDELNTILQEIKSGAISQRQASIKYKISRNTFRNKLIYKFGGPLMCENEE